MARKIHFLLERQFLVSFALLVILSPSIMSLDSSNPNPLSQIQGTSSLNSIHELGNRELLFVCDSACKTCWFTDWNKCNSCNDGSYYLYPDSSCRPTCPSPLLVQITTTATYGYTVLNCVSPCPSSDYIYCNGSCLTGCQSPFTVDTSTGVSICNFACPTSSYLYPDNSCRSTCTSPMVSVNEGGSLYCRKPCTSSNAVYPDNSCSLCTSPLTQQTDPNGVIICSSPCASASQSYMYANGSCSSTCDTPYALTTKGGITRCEPICSSSQHLYPNKTCGTTCASPLVNKVVDNNNMCTNPCSSSQYLLPDSTCSNTCDPPLTVSQDTAASYCQSACSSSSQPYIYWNSTCSSDCNFPLSNSTLGGMQLCQFPCGNSQSLFKDGSCTSSCSPPLSTRVEGGKTYCDSACTSSQFMYQSGVCLSFCNPPMVQHYKGGTNTCDPPCPNPTDIYYPTLGTCKSTCDAPYVQNNIGYINLCYMPIDNKELANLGTYATMINQMGVLSTIPLVVQGAAMPSSSASIAFGTVSKMILYIRYMDINYPSKLVYMFQSTNPNTLSFAFSKKITNKLSSNFKQRTLSYNFTRYSVSPSFIVNFWDTFVLLGILFGANVVVRFMEWAASKAKKNTAPHTILHKIRMTTQSICLMQFYNACSDTVLFSALEMRTNTFMSKLDIVSFVASICFVVLSFSLLCKHFQLIWNHQTIRLKPSSHTPEEDMNSFEQKHEGFQVLFRDFKYTSFGYEGGLFFLMIRTIIFTLVIVFLLNYVLLQAILLAALNITNTVYILLKRPFKRIVNLIQQILIELFLLIVNMSVFALAVMDNALIDKKDIRDDIGEVIIVCSSVFLYLPHVFAAIRILLLIKDIYSEKSRKKKQAGLKLQQEREGLERNNVTIGIESNANGEIFTMNPLGRPRVRRIGREGSTKVQTHTRPFEQDSSLDSSKQERVIESNEEKAVRRNLLFEQYMKNMTNSQVEMGGIAQKQPTIQMNSRALIEQEDLKLSIKDHQSPLQPQDENNIAHMDLSDNREKFMRRIRARKLATVSPAERDKPFGVSGIETYQEISPLDRSSGIFMEETSSANLLNNSSIHYNGHSSRVDNIQGTGQTIIRGNLEQDDEVDRSDSVVLQEQASMNFSKKRRIRVRKADRLSFDE